MACSVQGKVIVIEKSNRTFSRDYTCRCWVARSYL